MVYRPLCILICLSGFLITNARASVEELSLGGGALSQESVSVLTFQKELKSCIKSGLKKQNRVQFSETRNVLQFTNIVEKVNLEDMAPEDVVFSDRTSFTYQIPFQEEKRVELVLQGDLDVHLKNILQPDLQMISAMERHMMRQFEEKIGREKLRQIEIRKEGGFAQYNLKLAKVLVLHANRMPLLIQKGRSTNWLAQGDTYRKAASLLIGAIDHRDDEELIKDGMDPDKVEALNEDLRRLYLDSLVSAVDSFGLGIEHLDSVFHESCMYYLRTMQALLHENEYEIYDEMLHKIKRMLPDRMRNIHGDPSECPECLEVIRNVTEKETLLKWLQDAEKKGFETRVYAHEQLQLQNAERLAHEKVVFEKKKKVVRKVAMRKLSFFKKVDKT